MGKLSDRLDKYACLKGGGRIYDFGQGKAFKVAPETEWFDEKATRTDVPGRWKDQGKMYKMVLRRGAPMGGVCATICAFWIVFHSSQDTGRGADFTRGRTVWQYLFDQNGLNLGAAQNITVEHLQSSGRQLAYLESFMRRFGIKRRKRSMSGAWISHAFVPFNGTTVQQCASEITDIGGYKLIQLKKTLDGSGSGHMVAAWCDGFDVLFMDPNLGEFWLPNKAAFHAWLKVFRFLTYSRYVSIKVHDFA